MKQNKILRGTLPPLFDRIVADPVREGIESQYLNDQQVKESIIREVSVILNTRCTVRKVIYEGHIESIPLFGMPDFFGLGDFNNFDASNPQEWTVAARYIETAIQAAEPRLENIRAKVDTYDAVNQALSVTISASLKSNKLMKEIHFPLQLHQLSSTQRKSAA